MTNSKEWLTIVEIEMVTRRTGKGEMDEENNGTLEKNDKRANINVEKYETAYMNVEKVILTMQVV